MRHHHHARVIALAWLVALAALAPSLARASGAWQTYQRPLTFPALIAQGDTVWCATGEAGLLLYHPSTDGFETIAREPNGLASNHLTTLVFDRSGRLWVGTQGAGASVLSADHARWSLVNAFDGLPSDTVTALTVNGDSMWIGTQRGLAVWDGRQISGVLPDGVNPSPFPSDTVTGVVRLGDSLWVATPRGVRVSRLSADLSTWTPADSGLSSITVDELVTDGAIPYALAQTAVHRWDVASGRWVKIGGIGPVFTLSSAHGTILAGTFAGLWRWNGAAWTALDLTLQSSAVSPLTLTLDAHGRAYAAGRPTSSHDVSGTGVYRQPDAPGPWTFAFPPGPPDNDCLNLDIDQDRLYVTTNAGGIGRLRNGTWTNWLPHRPDTSSTTFFDPRFVYALLVDRDRRKWFACWAPQSDCVTDTGVVDVLDDVTSSPDRIRHIYLGPEPRNARRSFAIASALDTTGGHWFGLLSPCDGAPDLDAAGLEYYARDGRYVGNFSGESGTVVGLPNDHVLALATDRRDRLWIGTNTGLAYVDRPDTAMTFLHVNTVPSTNGVAIHGLETYGDSLWLFGGSEVQRFTLSGAFRGSYTVPGGASTNTVRPLAVAPDGTVWLGTVGGLRAYLKSGDAVDYTSANSPLVDDAVRTVRVDPRTGVVWVATANGINRFDPGYVPPVTQLTSLSLSVYPNPGRLSALGIGIRLAGNGSSYTGTVYDLNGRVVHRFESHANGREVWNGLDDHGGVVRPGIYFVRATSGGRSAVARLVLLR